MSVIPPSPILSSRSPHRRRMRCLLAVPAVRQEFFQKAADNGTDALFLDLEDSVFPEQKLVARANAARALNEVAWKDKRVLVASWRHPATAPDFTTPDYHQRIAPAIYAVVGRPRRWPRTKWR